MSPGRSTATTRVAILSAICLSAVPGCRGGSRLESAAAASEQTDVPNTTAMPHGNHNPRYGGLVMMNGDLHFEVVLRRTGHYRVYFSDATRVELPASIASEVTIAIARPSAPQEVIHLQIDETGECWIGDGSPVRDADAIARITYTRGGEPYWIDLPFPGAAPESADGADLGDSVREYVRLVAALGERDPDSIDFYVGPTEWIAGVRQSPPALNEIKNKALKLAGRFDAFATERIDRDVASRASRVARELRALSTRTDVLSGTRLPFDEESQLLFGIEPGWDQPEAAKIRSEIDRTLGGAGSLRRRYEHLARRFAIPANKLEVVVARAIAACRERTLAHLALPAIESVAVEYVSQKPWSGFSRYDGGFHSTVFVNVDFEFTVDQALDLACHETYPGHHTRSVLLDMRFVREKGWPEFLVQPLFGPASLIAETSAMLAASVAFPGIDRLQFEREALCPLAGMCPTDLAKYVQVERLVERLGPAHAATIRRFIDGELDFPRAEAALASEELVGDPAALLKFANRYRSYVSTYTRGPAMAADVLDRCVASNRRDRWQCFDDLMTSMDGWGLMTRGQLRGGRAMP